MRTTELLTRLVFNNTVVVEISSGDDTAMIYVSLVDDEEDRGRSVSLYADEIGLLISSLELYKKRLEAK